MGTVIVGPDRCDQQAASMGWLCLGQLLLGQRQAVKNGLDRRLAVAPTALVGSNLVKPLVEVGLQLDQAAIELLSLTRGMSGVGNTWSVRF